MSMNKRKDYSNCILEYLISYPLNKKIRSFSLTLFILLVFFYPCHPFFSKPSQEHLIKDVPFFPQEDYQCGPASLAGILSYWKVPVSPSEITGEVYSNSAKGTLGIDLAHYAGGKGVSVKIISGSWEELTKLIEAGYPILVFVDLGFLSIQANHFMVVVGYDKGGVIVNSGKEKGKKMKKRKFLRAWEKNDFWMLLVKPEELQ